MKWQAALALALVISLIAWSGIESLVQYQRDHQPTPLPVPELLPTPTPDISSRPPTTDLTNDSPELLRQQRIQKMLTQLSKEVEGKLSNFPCGGRRYSSAMEAVGGWGQSVSIDGYTGTAIISVTQNGRIIGRRVYKKPGPPRQLPVVALSAGEVLRGNLDGLRESAATVCPGDKVQLRAIASGDPRLGSLFYSWTTSGGRVIGDGANPVFDTVGLASGDYTITVEVDDGCGLVAFDSKTIRVTNCPPPIICFGPNIQLSLESADAVKPNEVVTIKATYVIGGRNYGDVRYYWAASSGKIKDNGLSSQLDTSGVATGTVIEITVRAESDRGCSARGSTRIVVKSEE